MKNLSEKYRFLNSTKKNEGQTLIYRRIGLFLGTAIALLLAISLLLTGIATIPLLGPGSFVPVWLGKIIFIAMFVAPLSGMGWYSGKYLDTWETEHFSNEPLFMSIFLTAGLVFLTVLAFSQPQITIPTVLSSAGWNWLSTSVFVVIYTALAGSLGNFFGRVIDIITENRNLITVAKSWLEYQPHPYHPLDVDKQLESSFAKTIKQAPKASKSTNANAENHDLPFAEIIRNHPLYHQRRWSCSDLSEFADVPVTQNDQAALKLMPK